MSFKERKPRPEEMEEAGERARQSLAEALEKAGITEKEIKKAEEASRRREDEKNIQG